MKCDLCGDNREANNEWESAGYATPTERTQLWKTINTIIDADEKQLCQDFMKALYATKNIKYK